MKDIFFIFVFFDILFSIPSFLKKEKLGIPIPSTNETYITNNNDDNSEKVVEISSSINAKQIPETLKERKAEIIILFLFKNKISLKDIIKFL